MHFLNGAAAAPTVDESSNKVVIVRVSCGGGPRTEIQFCKNVAQVSCNGFFADLKFVGDSTIRNAGSDQPEYLNFAFGQLTSAVALVGGQERPNAGEVLRCAEALKGLPRRGEFEACALLVFKLATRLSDQNAHTGCLVGRIQLAPYTPRLSEFDERLVRVAVREENCATGARR